MWGNDHMKLTHLSRFRAVPLTAVKCFVHHIVDKAQPSHSVQSCKQVWNQSSFFDENLSKGDSNCPFWVKIPFSFIKISQFRNNNNGPSVSVVLKKTSRQLMQNLSGYPRPGFLNFYLRSRRKKTQIARLL